MSTKPTITNVDIKIGQRQISLSLDEILELRDLLNINFPEPIQYVPTTYLVYIPIPTPPNPYRWWKTICHGTTLCISQSGSVT